jgi:MFS family permease
MADVALGAERQPPSDATPWPRASVAWGTVSLLTFAYFVSFIDRKILALLVEPIKHSLNFSDTQIGMLQGAFGIFYTIATYPAGWLADKGNRMRVIGWGIAIWSLATALCGVCVNFTQLFIARMGVAAGEATLTPAAPSVIADSFPVERRTIPLTIYGWGAGVGAGGALIVGGLVAALVTRNEKLSIFGYGAFEPWQVIFFMVGLPGMLLSLVFFLAHEPRRRESAHTEVSSREVMAILTSRRAIIIPHFAGYCLYSVYTMAMLGWLPAFFMRVHGWSMADVGFTYGSVQLVSGATGAIAGGLFARFLWKRGLRSANLLTSGTCFALMILPAILGTTVKDAMTGLLLLGFTVGCSQASGGANIGAIQEIIPNRLRARVTALFYVLVGFVGITLGPLMIGAMNDYVFPGAAGIGKSMAVTALMVLPPAAILTFIAAHIRTKLDWAE